jgi:hypothetical protein
MSRTVNRQLDVEVRERAGNRCEYCHMPQACSTLRLTVDHVVAVQHHGPSDAANLALACIACNRRKGPNLSGIDPETGAVTTLFNPRAQSWQQHFSWRGAILAGLTDQGRATIDVLAINSPQRTAVRLALMASGEFPRDFE